MNSTWKTPIAHAVRWTCGAALCLVATTVVPAVGPATAAPDFTLHSMDGPNLRLQEQRGRVVMVNFWATWCGPCAKELPAFQKVFDRHKDQGLVVLGMVSADPASDEEILKFASQFNLSFPLVRSSDATETTFGMGNVLPATFLYDRSGRLRRHWDGAIREDALEEEVRVLLQ